MINTGWLPWHIRTCRQNTKPKGPNGHKLMRKIGVCAFLLSPLVSERCCLLFGWRAGHAWSHPPSWPLCLGIDSCSHSVEHCTWAACQTRSLSLLPASSLLSCADASFHWLEGSQTQIKGWQVSLSPRASNIINNYWWNLSLKPACETSITR